jgi:hypothetical protein
LRRSQRDLTQRIEMLQFKIEDTGRRAAAG